MAVQCCHAAITATQAFKQPKRHPSLVLCEVKNELHLAKIINKLEGTDIKFKTFREPDLNNSITALATEPIRGDKRKFFEHLPLLKGDSNESKRENQKL